jgi:hypothetical protein
MISFPYNYSHLFFFLPELQGATVTIRCSLNCSRPNIGQFADSEDCFLNFVFYNSTGGIPDGVPPFNCSNSWYASQQEN